MSRIYNYNIIFIGEGGKSVNMQATSETSFSELSVKYFQQVGIPDESNYIFIYNSKKIGVYESKKLRELNIQNRAQIKCVNSRNCINKDLNVNTNKNLNILFNSHGKTISIQAQSDKQFKDVASDFYNKFGLKQFEIPTYFFNSHRINADESKTLAELGLKNQANIDVVIISTVVGAIEFNCNSIKKHNINNIYII